MDEWTGAVTAIVIGAICSGVVCMVAVRVAPERTHRTNVEGRQVPAVLGWGVLVGGLAGLLSLGAGERLGLQVTGSLLVAMFFVGLWDDLKGDERPRGFAGHLGALRGGAVTGGMVKLLGGGLAGLGVMFVLDGLASVWFLLLGGACIALTANLFNLLDRAPGRAGKVWLLAGVMVAGISPDWRLWAAGTIGAVVATLPLDLRAVGMLGDAGANPMGAVLGLGLVLASGSIGILAAVVLVLMGLNLLSERVSFSEVIAGTPWLARLDHLGRK